MLVPRVARTKPQPRGRGLSGARPADSVRPDSREFRGGMQRLLLREGLVLLLVAVVCCQAEDFSTAAVRSGPQLAAALADPRVLLVSVEASILVQDSDWDRYAAALPLQLDRNVTLRGARTVPDLYTLNLNFVKRKVQLGNSMALTFEDLVINRYREMLPAQAPGFDLLAPTYASGPHAFLVIRGGALLNRACFPPAVRIEVAVLPRPEEVAPAYSFRLPSPNASSLPCPGPIGTFCPSGANLTFRIAVRRAGVLVPLAGCGGNRGGWDGTCTPLSSAARSRSMCAAGPGGPAPSGAGC
ncbi:hypothetical protein TSOC_013409 [Tetrabaena socialis]|uniref:Uncharacterized protein n=1 Tax=Tetrabaena socialis TaxID=47790 RepID=A0A2J7ZKE9_9CHLO|nr:hypothetical protein TSOC_013409 [Tetrabaena socialis]|eukprot:PNH00748.1 hypothetical protein TSOC_013409 [Tetrabaena socialis]